MCLGVNLARLQGTTALRTAVRAAPRPSVGREQDPVEPVGFTSAASRPSVRLGPYSVEALRTDASTPLTSGAPERAASLDRLPIAVRLSVGKTRSDRS